MGKQRRQRFKLHTPSPRKVNDNNISKAAPNSDNDLNKTWPMLETSGNIFENIKIDLAALKKELPEDDVKSVKSLKPNKSLEHETKIMKKKDKLQMRKQLLLRKIDTVNQLKKEMKKKKKRSKPVIVGNLNPLQDALPSLKSLIIEKKEKIVKNKTKAKGIKKGNKRQNELTRNVKIYKDLMNLDCFKTNPLDVIKKHVNNFVKSTVK